MTEDLFLEYLISKNSFIIRSKTNGNGKSLFLEDLTAIKYNKSLNALNRIYRVSDELCFHKFILNSGQNEITLELINKFS